MSSVIPARLQFQCGHAALVTLPRIKGETATQRNDRIAREKSAALARQCDFCAPALSVASNGNGHAPESALYQPEPEIIPTAAEPDVDMVAIAEVVVPDIVVADEEPVVEEPAPVESASAAEVVETALPVAEEEAAPSPAPRRRATPTTRKPRAEEVARGRRFLVEYRVERVLHAVDIHDALRQAANFGATRLTAITRED
jgi:hypothetical protein